MELNLKDKLNLSPDDLRLPPVILQEFANQIKRETGGLVTAEVKERPKSGESFYYVVEYSLTCPVLPYFAYRLMQVWYRIDNNYNLNISVDKSVAKSAFGVTDMQPANSGEEFKQKVSQILTCPRTIEIMNEIIHGARVKQAEQETGEQIGEATMVTPQIAAVEMTEREAIKTLVNTEYADKYQGDDKVTAAHLMALDALGKRIPKPVIRQKPLDHDVQIGAVNLGKGTSVLAACPTCKANVIPSWQYCPNCGQAIEWQTEDEA